MIPIDNCHVIIWRKYCVDHFVFNKISDSCRRHKGNSVILSLKFDYKYYIRYWSTAYQICRFSFITHVLISAVDAELYMNARVTIVLDHSNTVNVTYAMVNFECNYIILKKQTKVDPSYCVSIHFITGLTRYRPAEVPHRQS
jgi:hypothetical protein